MGCWSVWLFKYSNFDIKIVHYGVLSKQEELSAGAGQSGDGSPSMTQDNRYSSFIGWSPEQRTLTLKNRGIFECRIVPKKLGVQDFDAFISEVGSTLV